MANKTLLLTGASGFIGHHVFEHIMKNTGWSVILLDGLGYAGNLNRLADIDSFREWKRQKRFTFCYHDIRSPFNESILAGLKTPINYVIHLAAETFVDRSLAFPLDFAHTNIIGTINALSAAEKFNGLEKFIYVSTDEVFGPAPEGRYYGETDAFNPSNPYSASKAGAECFVGCWKKCKNFPALIVRTMNNFGERQHPEKFIGSLLRTMMRGQESIIHGRPGTVGIRHWLHARNFADALLYILRNDRMLCNYHVRGEEMDILTLAGLVAEFSGLELRPRYVDHWQSRPGHDRRYALADNNLKALGWRPPFSLRDSLCSTVRWTLAHPHWLDMEIFTSVTGGMS